MIFEIVGGAFIVGSFIYHRWIEDHPKPNPNGIGTPHVDEGAAVPLVYGRCRVRAPILAWAGSQRQLPVGRSPQHVDQQFAYFLDMLYVVGIPFFNGTGELMSIFAAESQITVNSSASWTGNQTVDSVTDFRDFEPAVIPVNGPPTAGRTNYWVSNPVGPTFALVPVFPQFHEEAVNFAFVEFFDGRATQTISDGIDDDDDEALTDTQAVLEAEALNTLYGYFAPNLSDKLVAPPLPQNFLPSQIPSYRNMMLCCMYRWCNGDSTSMPPYSFEVRVLSSMFGHTLTNEADPAAVLYDLITSPWGKLALPASKVDTTSFQAASDTLYAEQHGYSRSIEEVEDATAIIADILKQIDGILYEEPTTGKLVLKLVRNDYDPNNLDDINPGNMEAPGQGWYQVQGWSETLNQVRVTYTARDFGYADAIAIAQNPANIVSQGGKLRPLDLRFVGCCTSVLAQKLASRELAVVSRPMVKATVTVTRGFYGSRPGDVKTLTFPELGVSKMVMRVVRVDLGQLHDGKIKLDLVRDIFDVTKGAF